MSGAFRPLLQLNEQTMKVLSWWIRNNYAANIPVSVILVAVKFAGQVRSQFDKTHHHCIVTPDNGQTVTFICKIDEHLPSFCRGTIAACTEFGMYRWIIKLNKFSKHMIIGVAQFPWNKAFIGLIINVDTQWSMSKWKNNKLKRLQKDPAANVEDGDKVKIIIHQETAGFEVFNDEGTKWQISHKIEPGKYKLFVTLEEISDSVSIIDYTQLI